MSAETSRTTPSLDEGELSQHVDQRLFDDSRGTLTDHVVRKTVLGNKRRYTILFLLGERDEIARKELAEAIDDGSFDLNHYLSELVSVRLIARIGTSEGE